MSELCSNYNPVVGLMCDVRNETHKREATPKHINSRSGHRWDDEGGVFLCGAERSDNSRCHLKHHDVTLPHVGRNLKGETVSWYISPCASKSAEGLVCGGLFGHTIDKVRYPIHMTEKVYNNDVTTYVWESSGGMAMELGAYLALHRLNNDFTPIESV